jgi:hypothetical protein
MRKKNSFSLVFVIVAVVSNFFFGTVPSEIANLKKLSKYNKIFVIVIHGHEL